MAIQRRTAPEIILEESFEGLLTSKSRAPSSKNGKANKKKKKKGEKKNLVVSVIRRYTHKDLEE